jgi:CheY-like chemotaxis protein
LFEAFGGCGVNIVLVEDEDSVRKLVRSWLHREGHALLEAVNGAHALAQLDYWKPGHIDLLVTDLVMPGMFGYDLARVIHKDHPEMAVLYVSGYPVDEIELEREEGKYCRFGFLRKPFSKDDLLKAISKFSKST